MGKSKRKYRKKNKRTRKKRGGIKPSNDKLYNFTKNPDLEEQACIQHPDPTNPQYNKEPTWIQYLEAANKGYKLTTREKLAERKKWCGNNKKKTTRANGYCHSPSGTAEVKISKDILHRCLPEKKSKKYKNKKTCRIHLRPEDYHHCTKTCGRPVKNDRNISTELYNQKLTEKKLECNDAKVFIGNKFYSLPESLEAIEKYDKKVEERNEKKKKEMKRKKIALAKAKAVAAKAKLEEARLKEKQDADAKKARETSLAKEKKRVDDAKMKCVKDMEINLEKKFSEIETAILTHGNEKYDTIYDLFHQNWSGLFSHEGVVLVEKKLRMLNGLNQEVLGKLDECFDKITETEDFGEEADKKFEITFKNYKTQIETMYVDIVKIKMELFKQDQELYDTYTPMDLEKGIPFAQIGDDVPTRCRQKKLCDDKRKKLIKNKKKLSKTPEFCIGNVVRGGIYPKSSFDYTGVVIGNAIEKGVPSVYLNVSGIRGMSKYPGPLYPVVYHSPYYNNGSWPFYGLMYGVHRPKKSETEEFKTWYYKMLKRHGDTTLGKYPEKTLQAMIKGVITQKGKKNLGKNPQLVPKPFIRYLPCKQTAKNQAAYNKSRQTCTGALVCKKPRYQRSEKLCRATPGCKYIGKKGGGRRKKKKTRRKKNKKRRCTKKKR